MHLLIVYIDIPSNSLLFEVIYRKAGPFAYSVIKFEENFLPTHLFHPIRLLET